MSEKYNKIKKYTHMFKFENKYFMFDISTSTVFELGEKAYELINYIIANNTNIPCRYLEKDIENVKFKLSELLEKNYFVKNLDFYSKSMNTLKDRNLKCIELNVSHTCNMNCRYCYGEYGSYGGQEMLMNVETSKMAIDFLIKNSGDNKELVISFFGGEPLMNFNVIKQSVYYSIEQCKKYNKEISFDLTTNGTLLSGEIMDFIIKHNINIVLSMDGEKGEQDYLRPLRDNKSSYDTIAKKLVMYQKSKNSLYCRSTITRKNKDILKNINTFKNLKLTSLFTVPVESDDKELALTIEDYEKIKNDYTEWTKTVIKKIQNTSIINLKYEIYLKFLYDGVMKLYHGSKRIHNCGAGRNMVCINPDGEVFLCHRFCNNKKYKVGDIYEGLDTDKNKDFSKIFIEEDEECNSCWLKFLCSGGCLHQRLDSSSNELVKKTHGDLYCNFLRHIYELSIVLYNEIMQSEENKNIIKELY